MIDHRAEPRSDQFPPPKPTDLVSASGAVTPTRLPHPVALFAVAFGLGMVAALVTGFGVGALAFSWSSASCSPSDGWCGLGAALVALFAGAVVGSIAYIVAGVTTIFRSRPVGRRSRHVVAHVAIPPAAFVLLNLLGAVV